MMELIFPFPTNKMQNNEISKDIRTAFFRRLLATRR